MKKSFASFLASARLSVSLSLILVSCSVFTPAPTSTPLPTPTTPPDPMQTPWDDRSIFKDGLIQAEQSVLDELKGASVYHLDIKIADNIFHVTGREEVRYTNTETVPLNEIQFRLFPNILGGEMTITNPTVNGQSVTPEYGLQNSLMVVPLPKSLEPGQITVLKMEYAVTVPQSVVLNYGVLAYYEDVLALAHAYPMICVFDDEGWNAEIPPQDGDVTFGDSAFYLVRVTAPKGLTLVTSGREISHDEAGQFQVAIVANGPARDFYLAASPRYEKISQKYGEVTIRSFAAEDSQEGARFVLAVASQAIDVYGKRYAPYPYTELDFVATPTSALGIEYPGMIAIADRIYGVENNSPGSPTNAYLESTVAHEVGHQWFYGLVGDDQLDDPWLDESLAQFVTLQYFTDKYGLGRAQSFRASLDRRWASVGNADIPIGLPVAGYNGAEYSAIVYGRGPLFFVALRDKIGTEAFDAFLKEYTETLSWGIATPEMMRAFAEKHCNCDLQGIFDEWIYPKNK